MFSHLHCGKKKELRSIKAEIREKMLNVNVTLDDLTSEAWSWPCCKFVAERNRTASMPSRGCAAGKMGGGGVGLGVGGTLPVSVCVVTRQLQSIMFSWKCQLGAVPAHFAWFLSWKKHNMFLKYLISMFNYRTVKSAQQMGSHFCNSVQYYSNSMCHKDVIHSIASIAVP